jgi:HK97 family phage major capsid protein
MKLKELLEKRASLFEEVQKLANLEEISDEQRTEFTAKSGDLKKLDEDIKFEEGREEMRKLSARAIEDDAKKADVSKEEMEEQYRDAFRAYMRANVSDSQREILQRASQGTPDADGGYTIPEGFSGMLEKAWLYYTPFDESLVTVWRTPKGNDMPWPTTNDTSVKGYLLNEGDSAATGATKVTFDSVMFKSYMLTSGFVGVSKQLITDSYFDIGALLSDLFAERIGRGMAQYFTTGTGVDQPEGVVTAAAVGVESLVADAISRADILGLIGSLDRAYRANATFMFNDATFDAIKELDFGTADARPLYQESAIAGEPGKIEGFPFVINNDMDGLAATNVSVLFGDFKKYVVRYAGVEEFVSDASIYVEKHQIGMGLFKRIDGRLLNAGTGPIRKLTQKS